ncbi:MAG TPA: hypothetical protein PL060_01850, partial [bacterium]|nr:hypothetical protein [bacterium]
TDEWGNPYQKPLFSDMVSSGRAMLIKDDVLKVGNDPDFLTDFQNQVDALLGKNKMFFFKNYGNDVETAVLEKGAKEKFVLFLNWTDRPVQVEAGLKLPDGNYECFQRDLNEVRRVMIGSETKITARNLQRFLVSLQPWEMKILYIKGVQ